MAEDTTEPIPIEQESALIVDAEHTGGSNFQVELLDIDSGNTEYLINEQGDFDGRIIAPVKPGQYVFNVVYDKSYSLTPTGIEDAEVHEPPVQVEGSDYDVIPVQLDGASRLSIEAETDSNVQMELKNGLGETADYLFNEVGPGEFATTITTEGLGLFYLQLVDDWVFEVDPL